MIPRRAMMAGLAVLLSSSVVRARGNPCVERGTVVGEQRCRRFGSDWAVPFPTLALSWSAVTTAGPIGTDTVSTQRPGAKSAGAVPASALGLDGVRTWGAALRADFGLRLFYFGIEAAVGGGGVPVRPAGIDGSPDITLDAIRAWVGAPLGFTVPLDRLTIRVEIVPRAAFVDVGARTSGGTMLSASAWRLEVEPRLRGDIWIDRRSTIGAWIGTGGSGRSPASVGISYAFHLTSYDGTTSWW